MSVRLDIDQACDLKMNQRNYTPLEENQAKQERNSPMETTTTPNLTTTYTFSFGPDYTAALLKIFKPVHLTCCSCLHN